MKAKDVSVMVVQLPNDELYVNVTMKIRGNLLLAGDTKVQEHMRRAKAKEIRKLVESLEFYDATIENVVGHE